MRIFSIFSTLAIGFLAGYVIRQQQIIALQSELLQTKQPPKPATRADWWESHRPDSDDDMVVLQAHHDWLRDILVRFVQPYIDKNVLSILMLETLQPLNEKLTALEMQRLKESRDLEVKKQMRRSNGLSTDD